LNSHQQVIKKINEYSIAHTPFFMMVDFEMQQPVLLTLEELASQHIAVSFPTYTNQASTKKSSSPTASIDLHTIHSMPKASYQAGYDKVMKALKYGNSYLTNYTGKTKIETDATLLQIFNQAQARYKICYQDEWVCFSPECFIQIHEGAIFSYPMKGTIDARLPNAAHTLLHDSKELAEHYTIVDLIRNDLNKVSTEVVVEKFRYLEEIHSNHKNLLQASTKIKGLLPNDYQLHLGDLLFSLLPAGSISGAPKKKTIETIQEAEACPRGYYTGVAFYFDGEHIDSCVMIRFIEKVNGEYFYRSGGGITVNSDMEKEYQELNDKIYVPIY